MNEKNMYTVIAMLNDKPESLFSLGTFYTKEEAEEELKRATKVRQSIKRDYFYTKIIFNYFG